MNKFMECIDKNCYEYKKPLQDYLFIYKKKLRKLIPKIKTIKEIEEDYKQFKKLKKSSFGMKYGKCVKEYCKFDNNIIDNSTKANLFLKIILINEKKDIKYPFWSKLENKINKLLQKNNITKNDRIRLSYYIILLSCLVEN